jgi:hypothetical protein
MVGETVEQLSAYGREHLFDRMRREPEHAHLNAKVFSDDLGKFEAD